MEKSQESRETIFPLVPVKVVGAADFKLGSKRRERTKAGSPGGDPDTQPHLLRAGFPFSPMLLPRGDRDGLRCWEVAALECRGKQR